MEHVTLAQKPCRIAQESPLLLARKLCRILGPGDQFEVFIVVAQTHQAAEKVEILFPQRIALARDQVVQLQEVAAGQTRHVAGLQRVGNALSRRDTFQYVGGYARNADLLRPRNDRRQQPVGLLGDQNEKRPLPRLFEDFEDLVGSLLVHRLRKPDEHRLIIGLEALEREFADDLVGLAGRDHAFERLAQVEPVVPVLRRNIAAPFVEQRAEQGQELVAPHHLPGLLALFVHGKDQMQVGMRQRCDLFAIGTLAARVAVAAVTATEVLHISHGQRQRPGTGQPREELGMAHTAGIDRLCEMSFQIVLSYDVRKSHLISSFSAPSGAWPPSRSARGGRGRRRTTQRALY